MSRHLRRALKRSRTMDDEVYMKRLTCVLAVVISGCVTNPKHFEKVLDSWVGTSADQLVWIWGPPTSVYPLSGGKGLLTYSSASAESVTVASAGLGLASTSYHVHACTAHFLVSEANVVSGWHWTGNSCAIPDPDKKTYSGYVPPTAGWSTPKI